MEFPYKKYKDFKFIKIPYSQAHENKARREFGMARPKQTLSIERDIIGKGLDIEDMGRSGGFLRGKIVRK